MSSSQVSKMKKYIQEDRPRRLRTYVKKHHLNVSAITLYKGRNLLHYCCKYGSGTMMKYLILEGVSCLVADSGGATPVHLALHRSLRLENEGKHDSTTQCYTEIILPLIEKFPSLLDMKNAAGETCRELLHTLVQRREPGQGDHVHDEDSDTDERAWKDKLADEYQHEYNTTWGKYEHDFTSYEAENETYDDWADKIREDYRARKRASRQWYQSAESTRQKSKRKHSEANQEENEDLKHARAKMRKRFEENKEKDKEMEILKRE